MTDIVDRLRDQGKDAFAKHYSLGMFKLCTEAADEIERLRKPLQNIADQMLTNEMDLESCGDFEGAYDIMIGIARRALALPQAKSRGEA